MPDRAVGRRGMIKIVDDERLIAKVCDMHYNQNMSQKTISEKLNLSRPTISRIITNGRERGIVNLLCWWQ